MGLFHNEIRDDAEGVTSAWYTSTTPRYKAGDDELAALIKRVNAEGLIIIGKLADITKAVPEVVIPAGHKLDYQDLIDRVKAEIGCHVADSTESFDKCLWFWRQDYTAEEYARRYNGVIEPTDIISKYGNANTISAEILSADDYLKWFNDGCKKELVEINGKLKLVQTRREVFGISGMNWDLYRYGITNVTTEDVEKPWWYPVRDTIDQKGMIKWLDRFIEYKAQPIPDVETLTRNTANYEADVVAKINAAIEANGFYIIDLNVNYKEWFWYDHTDSTAIDEQKYYLFKTRDEQRFILKAGNPLDIAKAEGLDVAKCTLVKPEEMADIKFQVFRDRIVVQISEYVDLKNKYLSYLTRTSYVQEMPTAYFLKKSEYSATKADIVAQFKKLNIDPYEVSKLTTIWHYINFACAIKTCLKASAPVFNTELNAINVLGNMSAADFKRKFNSSVRNSGYSREGIISKMQCIKNIAEKLGVPCRDAEATYKASEERIRR